MKRAIWICVLLLNLSPQLFGQGYRLRWRDRRSIGQAILSSWSGSSATNPRGWFNAPTFDAISPEGVEQFHYWMRIWADQMVARAKSMDSQGVIVWDIDGQQYGPYIGDPRYLSTEMLGVVDEFFAKFTGAGLRCGVTIRPQRWTDNPPSETDTNNPGQILYDKISYAHERWGCTLFYIDSNATSAGVLSADMMRRVARAFPDSLIIPEWETPDYYTFSAPYNELRMGIAETLAAYRPGFSVINTADGNFEQYWSQLVDGVKHGDVLLYRVWWDAEENPKVQAIYKSR